MKRFILLIVLLSIGAFLTGCSQKFLPSRVEIDRLNIIRVVGVDKGFKDPNNICVTVTGKKRGGGQTGKTGGQAEAEKAIVLTNEAPTFLEAERKFQTYSDKQMFWGHVDYYLIGEEAARENIGKYIDFLVRDHEMRINSRIYIVEGATAREFIEQTSTGEYFIADHLRAIGENSKLFTGSQELQILEFMQWLNDKCISAVVPTLYLKSIGDEMEEGKKPAMDIELNGYAAFKNLKLITIIDRIQARGENFLLNRVISGAIQVKDPSGAMVGLDIIDNNTKIAPVVKDGELQGMMVRVKLSSNVDEMHSTLQIFTQETLNFLSAQQSNLVKREIEQVINTAQENNADFINMALVLSVNHPILWEKYKDRWDDIFPSLAINVEVQSKINRTYDIREPNGLFKEDYK